MTRDELISHLKDCPKDMEIVVQRGERGIMYLDENLLIEESGLVIDYFEGKKVIIL